MAHDVKTGLYVEDLHGSILEQLEVLSDAFDRAADRARANPEKLEALNSAHDKLFELYTALEDI